MRDPRRIEMGLTEAAQLLANKIGAIQKSAASQNLGIELKSAVLRYHPILKECVSGEATFALKTAVFVEMEQRNY